MDSKLRTPNSELRTFGEQDPKLTTLPLTLDEVLSQVQTGLPGKVLFWGERAGEISSYAAGWLAGRGIEVILLDGANRFDPYMVSSFARKALIPPERLLKKIRIARAFTCYQMATLIGEKLACLFRQEEEGVEMEERWVILLGPMTAFLDEDVPEREVRPLFERSLRKLEEMALRGIPFLLFQPNGFSDSRRVYFTKRLFQIANEVWRISLEDEGAQVILEKGLGLNIIENCKLQNGRCKFIRKDLPYLSIDRKIL